MLQTCKSNRTVNSLFQVCLTITEPFSPFYLEEMKVLSFSRTVNQLIMRVRKPKVEYKLALQLDPREHLENSQRNQAIFSFLPRFPPQFFLFPFSTILSFSLLNVFIPSSTIFYYFPSSMFLIPLHHNFNIFPQFHYFPSSMLLFPPLQFYYFPSSSSPSSSSSSLLLFSLLHLLILFFLFLLILIVLIGSMWGRCRVDVGSMWGRCRVDVGSLLFSLLLLHIFIVFSPPPPPPPPPHFYCFPSTTTTVTFLLFSLLLLLISIVFPRKAKEAKSRPKRPRRPNLEEKQ